MSALHALLLAPAIAAAVPPADVIDRQIGAHPELTGTYVLEKGFEALIARAWLADHARDAIEVQYFIWSTDNIGILASEALLRAADRGVRVRVMVDDLLIDAPDDALLALARHPHVDIRIYNPQTSVGVPWWRRWLNLLLDFHGINQRMHDKTFVVDGKVAIVGGRNMAAEYFDYSREYNFRDRDLLLVGAAAGHVRASFDAFWDSPPAASVEELYDTWLMEKRIEVDAAAVDAVYRDLHAYARDPANFAPEVRAAIAAIPLSFPALAEALVWSPVEFISDRPGKNDGSFSGGGRTGAALAALVDDARERIVIQSPYLVLSDAAREVFRRARARGVRVRIHTNSLASTDNLQAFSGYRNQRDELLRMGLEIHEFRPDARIQHELMHGAAPGRQAAPAFGLHAKTLVVDGHTLFVGTFNLDPRSENLNTEVGAIVRDANLAARVEAAVETDMAAGNSWSAAHDDPDRFAPWGKRCWVRFYQLLPLRPLL